MNLLFDPEKGALSHLVFLDKVGNSDDFLEAALCQPGKNYGITLFKRLKAVHEITDEWFSALTEETDVDILERLLDFGVNSPLGAKKCV